MARLVNSKPFKVCDAQRKKRVGLTASTINDVKEKVKKYYDVRHQRLRIVEESDGTMLEDDEYLRTLPDYSLLMVLTDRQSWTARQDVQLVTTQEIDQTDSTENELDTVARSIRKNPARIPLLTSHELQLLADAEPEELAEKTELQTSEVADLQGYCNRRLRDHDELKDGIELLRLYKQSSQ